MCPTTLLEGVGLRISNRSALILLVCVLGVSTSVAESAKSLYHKGQVAEAKQDYLEAYAAYKAAYDEKPTDLRYRSAFERLKFQAAAVHVKRGQQLRQSGDLQKALQEFETAAQIDPSSFIAQQEIARTQAQISGAAGGGNTTQQEPKREDILRQRIEQAQGPVSLAPINDLSINMHISGDSKTIYQTIGKLAGINILFDPDYVARQLPPLELNGVTLQEALGIVSIQSGTFWRPVTPNTIFVAPNTQTKRKDLDQSVVKTFYLTNAASQTEFQDIANTLRTILDITRVQPIAAENAIVVRGSPDKVALAEKIVADLDKSRAEVVIDVAILQVSKERIRNLGFTPSLANGPIGIQLIPPGQTTTTNPNATNGQSSSSRIPIATGSFQPGIGGVGINPLVNTQFQYLDVGVNIDVQPTVHLNGDVTLKVTMDISSQTNTVSIGGIDQPVISQRKIDHQIRLREGEVNLLGGIFEDQDQKSFTGIPGLGQIPVLKYIFGSEKIDHTKNEVVFVLIPHLVRDQDVTDLNLRPIDVGTDSAIDLRLAPNRPGRGGQGEAPTPQSQLQQSRPAVPASAAPANPAATTGVAQAPAPANPAPAPSPQETATPAAQPVLRFDPPSITTTNGGTFTVSVTMNGGMDVASVPLQITYDPKRLSVVKIDNGDFLTKDGQPVALVNRDDVNSGVLVASASRPPGSGGVSGQGTVFTVTLQAKQPGDTVLSITRPGARNSQQQPIQVLGSQMTVKVQ
ncbi:MAG: type II and III secretion system protein [Acidobacteria bacterium]|nr:MAG: type II and III secretion system protein [Acidobacteriota bacterium]